jgi:hypothetical protein
MMDARSQVAHDAAPAVRIATWLRRKAATLPYRIIFGHNYSVISCDALDGADCGPDGMRMGKDPGVDERFGAWRSPMA